MAGFRAAALALVVSVASASDVVKLTEKDFDMFIDENELTMVEFFAPWCGHCKALAPEYDIAAGKLAEHDIKIAAVDAEAEKELAKKFDVNGYPTVKIFTSGKPKDYEGERKGDAIYHAMRHEKDPSYEIPKPSASDAWAADGGSVGAVNFLTDADFESFRADNPKVFTMFYAPWCGHCKALKPDITAVSTELKPIFADEVAGEEEVVIAAVDCTTETTTCKTFDVSGYPTLFYFDSAVDKGTKYEGGRTKKALKKFMVNKVDSEWAETIAPFENTEDWKEEEHGNGEVVHLTDDHFEWYRNTQSKHLLMMFYAPWCGHCKNLKPDWVEASTQMPKSFTMGALDCTQHSGTCSAVGANSYPTLKYFQPVKEGSTVPSETEAGEDYSNSGRATDDLVWFGRDKLEKEMRAQAKSVTKDTDFSKLRIKALKKILKERGAACDGCTDKSDFVKKVQEVMASDTPVVEKKRPKMTMMEEKRYKANKAAADKGWSDEEYGNGNVKHLIESDFEEYRVASGPVLAFFYAPWCGHCKSLKPEYVALSTQLKEEKLDVSLVALDCTTSASICQKYGANSYPTLKWFAGGKDAKAESFEGGRTQKALFNSIQKKLDPDFKIDLGTFVNPETWKDEDHGNGKVVHLDDDWFAPYRQDGHPKMLTMFYAPWCGHCKAMKPDFVAASTEADSTGVVFSAVDCTTSTTVCSDFGVSGYPTLKSFESESGGAIDYSGGRTKNDLVDFAKKLASKPAGAPSPSPQKKEEIEIDKDDL